MPHLKLILHNIRSAYNVGSLFRSGDAFGVEEIICTGYTPYPKLKDDQRLPHVIKRAQEQIAKTALGAEETVKFSHSEQIPFNKLRQAGYKSVALEQATHAAKLNEFKPDPKTALILGNEVEGLDKKTLNKCDTVVEIPMRGKKESLNVAVTGAIVMHRLTDQQ